MQIFIVTDPKQAHRARMAQLRNQASSIQLGEQGVFGFVRSIVKSGIGIGQQWSIRVELVEQVLAEPRRFHPMKDRFVPT